jgi:hypothetical protein
MLGLNMARWDWVVGLPRRYASRKDGFFVDWVAGLPRRYASRKDGPGWVGGNEPPLALVARGNGELQERVDENLLK